MNTEDAEKLSILLLQIIAKLDESAAFVKDKDTEENWVKYRSAVGKAMGQVCSGLEEPLLNRFPNLRPEQLGGSFKVNPDIYQPRFYDSDAPAT